MIEEGQEAPDFELPDEDGKPVRLSGLHRAVCKVSTVLLPNVKPKQHDELVLAAL